MRWLILTFLLVSAPVLAYGPNGEEDRCTELGVNCDCSETHDTVAPHYVTSAFPPGGCGGFFCVNPTNSTGASLECGPSVAPGYFWITGSTSQNPGTFWSIVPETGMPPGNTVTNVWRANTHGGGAHSEGTVSGDITSATRRLCQRIYKKFSSDYSLYPDCNNKVMEIDWGGFEYQSSTTTAGSVIAISVVGAGSGFRGTLAPVGDSITPADCVNTWCRIEQCADGNIQAGTSLVGDFYVDTTDGAKHAERTAINIGSGTGGISFIWPENLHREFSGGGTACNGTAEYSHVMQASWDTAAGQRIGPAREVEGTGSVTLKAPVLFP